MVPFRSAIVTCSPMTNPSTCWNWISLRVVIAS